MRRGASVPCTAQQSQQQEATAEPQAPREDMAARALEFFGMLPKQGDGGHTTGPEVSNAVPLTASAGASASLQQFRQRAREAADAAQAAGRSAETSQSALVSGSPCTCATS